MKKKSGGKFDMTDFMQWGERPPDEEASIQEVFAMLKSARTK